ncbi:hypothetical protein [Klebsiella pneumoniae]|uniref:hypothetical protein n=1 Tax=Klebsiella pneumoniae TaxID=573 RepID=UPI002949729E|nr:hypothetical protein [Klebsiella pneumoniae]MDV5727971.1 hypothetical protein [Klebsiella pneumoniae]
MDKKYDFSLSYEALTRVCENAICEHIRRAGSLEGLGFALEYTKAYAILKYGLCWQLLAIHFQLSLRKTEYICCN